MEKFIDNVAWSQHCSSDFRDDSGPSVNPASLFDIRPSPRDFFLFFGYPTSGRRLAQRPRRFRVMRKGVWWLGVSRISRCALRWKGCKSLVKLVSRRRDFLRDTTTTTTIITTTWNYYDGPWSSDYFSRKHVEEGFLENFCLRDWGNHGCGFLSLCFCFFFSLFFFLFLRANTTETRVLINIPLEQKRYFFPQRFPWSLPGLVSRILITFSCLAFPLPSLFNLWQ